MIRGKKQIKKMIHILENILFNVSYALFWILWNICGIKWIFRAFIMVLDRADANDSERLRARMASLEKAGGV